MPRACRNFGVTLVLLGILMLIGGIIYHVQFMLRPARAAQGDDGRQAWSMAKAVSRCR